MSQIIGDAVACTQRRAILPYNLFLCGGSPFLPSFVDHYRPNWSAVKVLSDYMNGYLFMGFGHSSGQSVDRVMQPQQNVEFKVIMGSLKVIDPKLYCFAKSKPFRQPH